MSYKSENRIHDFRTLIDTFMPDLKRLVEPFPVHFSNPALILIRFAP